MERQKLAYFRERLRQEGARVMQTAASVEEAARSAAGGQGSGDLSNAPMHLGDVGTEVYYQELNATLLENENYLRDEIGAAIDRVDDGTFGRCENCGGEISEGRLEALPYARHCATCAHKLQSGLAVNLNEGRQRPRLWTSAPEAHLPEDRRVPAGQAERAEEAGPEDAHAAGTPGGGTAVGGLAGTNIGEGGPDEADLEAAMGSGRFDTGVEDESGEAHGGPSGGAVGGTPAGKRTAGGKRPVGPGGSAS